MCLFIFLTYSTHSHRFCYDNQDCFFFLDYRNVLVAWKNGGKDESYVH